MHFPQPFDERNHVGHGIFHHLGESIGKFFNVLTGEVVEGTGAFALIQNRRNGWISVGQINGSETFVQGRKVQHVHDIDQLAANGSGLRFTKDLDDVGPEF